MGFFKRLTEIFQPSGPQKAPDYSETIAVRCNRCGEILHARIDLRNDLSIDYGEGPESTTYFCRKVLMGEKRCFQKIDVELTYNSKRKLIARQAAGGEFVDEPA